ncbi:MAG: hypothetical protein OJF59_001289 [Cytophagales bacterium]|nr:MAG: hypothetical protein OJF59_001289 [Cytophagales bacterium]
MRLNYSVTGLSFKTKIIEILYKAVILFFCYYCQSIQKIICKYLNN